MSYAKSSDYFAFRKAIKILGRIVGLWPNNEPTTFYRFLPYFFFFVNLFVILGTFVFVKIHITNVALATKGLSMSASFLTIIIKILCVLVNREDVNELHNTLDRHFSKMLSNQQISTTILTDLTDFRRLSWTFICFVVIGNMGFTVPPIISIIHQSFHSTNPIIYPRVYTTEYPWSADPSGFQYKVYFIIELIAVISYFCVSPCIDCMFMMYGFQMMGQFREMSHRIMHIDEVSDDKNIVHECVLQHQIIMRCRDILQKIYGPILLCVTTTNAISLCTLIFQLSQMKSMSIPKIITFAAYLILKIVQTFMYAYAGTCLTTESENYQKAIYSADWQRNKRFMTSVLIMLSQKPIILTACNFSVISLDIFLKVLNTSVSYFFLLRTIGT